MSSPVPPNTGAGTRVSGMFGTVTGWGSSAVNAALNLIGQLGNFSLEPLGITPELVTGDFTIDFPMPELPPLFEFDIGDFDFPTLTPPSFTPSNWVPINTISPITPPPVRSFSNWTEIALPDAQPIDLVDIEQPTTIVAASEIRPVDPPGLKEFMPQPFQAPPLSFLLLDPIGQIPIEMPEMPEINVDDFEIDAGPVPEFSGIAPELDFGVAPSPERPPVPEPPDDLIDVNAYIPDTPDLEFPALPTLDELNLPEPPDINRNIEFDEELRPVKDITLPDLSLLEQHEIKEFTPELLEEVRTEVSRMLKGGTGLPPAVEQMIFDRSRVREDAVSDEQMMDSLDDWASRGFSMPSGVLDAKREKLRQQRQDRAATLNRELTIYVHEKEIENLRFAIEQGVAAERLYFEIHLSTEQLKLQLASTIAEVLINRFRAEVELYNADVAAFRVEAEIFRELIRAELTKVELYRAEIEAERVRGEINSQRIEIYRGQLEGINSLVNVYATQMRAAEIVGRVNEGKLRNFGLEIQAFSSQIQANAEEFRAYVAQVQAETAKMNGFEAEVRAFSARTQAYATSVEAQAIEPRLRLEAERTRMQGYQTQGQIYGTAGQLEITRTSEGWRANTAAITEHFRAEAARFSALADGHRTDAAVHSAAAQVESAFYTTKNAALNAQREFYNAQAREAQANASVISSFHSAQGAMASARSSMVQAQAAVASANASAQSSRISAEGSVASAEQQAHASRNSAISAANSALGSSAQAQAARFSAEASMASGEQSSFQSIVAAERARVESLVARARAGAAIYTGQASLFSGQATMYAAGLNASADQARLRAEVARTNAQLAMQAEETVLRGGIEQSRILVQSLQGAAQAASQLAAASMSAVNATAQISEQGSASNQWSSNYTRQQITKAVGDLAGSVGF